MSTKRDPVIAVITYFETADLALATQALALCQQTLRRRRGPKSVPKPSKAIREGTERIARAMAPPAGQG